jgi:hypothetical protein
MIAGNVSNERLVTARLFFSCEWFAYHSDVDDVLNGRSEQLISDAGSTHYEHNIVPISSYQRDSVCTRNHLLTS